MIERAPGGKLIRPLPRISSGSYPGRLERVCVGALAANARTASASVAPLALFLQPAAGIASVNTISFRHEGAAGWTDALAIRLRPLSGASEGSRDRFRRRSAAVTDEGGDSGVPSSKSMAGGVTGSGFAGSVRLSTAPQYPAIGRECSRADGTFRPRMCCQE